MTNGRNWAIVVGIDKYWVPSACLSGAVRDALKMREWLLDEKGGGIDPSSLFLLLSPNEPKDVPASIRYDPATHDNLITAITELVKQSGGKGDRLFFHFAGHGLAARINFTNEDALVPEDCTPEFPDKSLGLNSILEYLKCTQLHEQFFFIDACRNIPWEGEFITGRMPLPQRPDPTRTAIQQFVYHSTSPGLTAIENGVAGAEQGAFTQTLLAGLSGKGHAKVWDYANREYVVEVNRLLDYLVKEMTRRTNANWFQVPRMSGERGSVSGSNPVLARFPEEAMAEESLQILLDPFTIEAQAAVTVKRDELPFIKQGPVARLPVIFHLPPRIYTVHAEAVDFEPEKNGYLVELYEPQLITIRLLSKPSAAAQTVTSSESEQVNKAVEASELAVREPTATPSQPVLVSNEVDAFNLSAPEPTVMPAVSTTAMISAEAPEISHPKPIVPSEVVVSTSRRSRYRRERPNWKATLRFLLDKAKNLVEKYREIIHKTDLANLQKGIVQAEAALLNEDKLQGTRARNTLQNVFRNGRGVTQLCIAHMLAQESPQALAQRIARAVERLRKAYRTNDRAAADEVRTLLDLMLAELVLEQLKNYHAGNVDEFVRAFQRVSQFLKSLLQEDEDTTSHKESAASGFIAHASKRFAADALPKEDIQDQKNTAVRELAVKDRPTSLFLKSLLRKEYADTVLHDWVGYISQRDVQFFKSLLLTDLSERPLPKDESMAEKLGVTVRITLRLTTHDPVAPLEIASSAGQILKIGQGMVICEDLEPGFYRARVVLPENHITEKLVEVSHGIETVVFDSPRLWQSRLLREMLADDSFGGLHYDEPIRKPATKWFSTQVSTLLLLSAGFCRKTNVTSQSGLKVFFGLESNVHGSVTDYSWRFWSQQESVSDATRDVVESGSREGLAEFSCYADPGDYWLAVQPRKRKPNVFALKLLPGRDTILIFHVNAKGESRIFQYLLPFTDAPIEPDDLRRLDLMQRFYLTGRLDHAYEFARSLVESEMNEPTALCLLGFLLLKFGRWYEAGRVADQVVKSFNQLSDGYVLTSEWEASRGNHQAASDACRAALDRGLPIFASGLNYLFYRVRNHHVEHTRRSLLENMFKHRVRAMMWSAWTPENLSNASSSFN